MILEIIFSLLFKGCCYSGEVLSELSHISRLKSGGTLLMRKHHRRLRKHYSDLQNHLKCVLSTCPRTKDAHLSHVRSSDIYFYRFSGLRGRLSGHITFTTISITTKTVSEKEDTQGLYLQITTSFINSAKKFKIKLQQSRTQKL